MKIMLFLAKSWSAVLQTVLEENGSWGKLTGIRKDPSWEKKVKVATNVPVI